MEKQWNPWPKDRNYGFSHLFCLLPYHSVVPNITHIIRTYIYIYTHHCVITYITVYLYTSGGWEWLNKEVNV